MKAGRFTKFIKLRKSCGYVRVHRNLVQCNKLQLYNDIIFSAIYRKAFHFCPCGTPGTL
jgi:hypothetical protein